MTIVGRTPLSNTKRLPMVFEDLELPRRHLGCLSRSSWLHPSQWRWRLAISAGSPETLISDTAVWLHSSTRYDSGPLIVVKAEDIRLGDLSPLDGVRPRHLGANPAKMMEAMARAALTKNACSDAAEWRVTAVFTGSPGSNGRCSLP
jgi:hypothetical protein